MIILGIDPGLRCTGWGVIDIVGNRLAYVAHGVIVTDNTESMAARLAMLHQALVEIIQHHTPQAAAVEETFSNKNPLSSLKLGHARGVALTVPALYNVPVYEYAANRIKKAIVGAGHADKAQVAYMVQRLLPTAGAVQADAADALAVAICHTQYNSFNEKVKLCSLPSLRGS
jgi:crossover junction endodeoxyribonuclease RuvC